MTERQFRNNCNKRIVGCGKKLNENEAKFEIERD